MKYNKKNDARRLAYQKFCVNLPHVLVKAGDEDRSNNFSTEGRVAQPVPAATCPLAAKATITHFIINSLNGES